MRIAIGRLAKMGAHHEEKFVQFEGFAQEESGLQPHAVKLPVMFAGDDDDGRVARAVVAAQDFVECDAIQIGQANVEEDEMRVQVGNVLARPLSIVEKGELPVPVHFEGVLQEIGDTGIVFDNGDMPGKRDIILGRVCLQEIVSHVDGPSTD